MVRQDHDGIVNASTPEVRYHYDDGATAGEARFVRLSSVEYPGGREVFYLYSASGIGDALNRVEAIADDASGTTRFAEYSYLGASTIVAVGHPAVSGGLTLDYNATGNYEGWDRFGRVVNQQWTDGAGTTTLDHYTYTYDYNSNRTSRSNALNSALSESYSYDGLDRLIDVSRGGSDFQSWNLDGLGNWDSFDDQGSTETRTHNAANELTGIAGGINPTFDAAGNMTSGPKPDSPTDRQHYQYDAWNRLVRASADDGFGNPGTTTAQFEYDGRSFRIEKSAGGVLQAFFYNEGAQVFEVRENGNVNPSEQYVWDLRYIDSPIVFFRDTDTNGIVDNTLYYANDANMNVTALIDATTGDVVERYHYDAHGNVRVHEGDWTPRTASAFGNAYLFAGRRLDSVTGLYYYRARYYDGSLGRFIQRDPIGYFEDVNLYRYARNQATRLVDPFGLAPKDWTKVGPPKWVTNKETVYHRWVLIDRYYTLINGKCYDYKKYQKEQMKVIDESLVQEYHRENQELANLRRQRDKWRQTASQHAANSTSYNKRAAAGGIAAAALGSTAAVSTGIPVAGPIVGAFFAGAALTAGVYSGLNWYWASLEDELAAAAADQALAFDDQMDQGQWPDETKTEKLESRFRYTRWRPTNQFGYKATEVPLIFCLFSWCNEEPNDDATPLPSY